MPWCAYSSLKSQFISADWVKVLFYSYSKMWLNFKQLIYKWRSCVTTSWELWEHFMFYSAFLLTTQFIVDPSKDGQYHNYTRACACTRVYINMWLIFVYTNEGSNIGQSDKHEMICSVWTLVHVLPSWIG